MTDSPEDTPISRRDVLKSAGAASAGFALTRLGVANSTAFRDDSTLAKATDAPGDERAPDASAASMAGVPFDRHDVVRIAIVGTGLRGKSVLREWLDVPNVRIVALADDKVQADEVE